MDVSPEKSWGTERAQWDIHVSRAWAAAVRPEAEDGIGKWSVCMKLKGKLRTFSTGSDVIRLVI